LGDDAALPGLPPGEFRLDKVFVKVYPRRATVNDNTKANAVAFAESGDAEVFTVGAAGHFLVL
jgi:hypothetical protein